MDSQNDKLNELRVFFAWKHLPEHLQPFSKACSDLAEAMMVSLPLNAELIVGLRKLLEAKDCFIRSALLSMRKNEKAKP